MNKPGQRVAVPVPLALVGEVGVECIGQRGNGFRRSGQFGQVAEVPAGERDDHERHPVAAGEVLAVLAVDRVADPLARGAVHHHLGEEAEVARRRQRDVLQRNADPLALPGGVAVPQRGDDGQRRVDAARDVPRGQHVIDRCGELGGPGHHRKPEPGVDGVVHARAAVGAAGHLDVDQVGPQPRQRVVRMPLRAPRHS